VHRMRTRCVYVCVCVLDKQAWVCLAGSEGKTGQNLYIARFVLWLDVKIGMLLLTPG
jgi:hypothetical protein